MKSAVTNTPVRNHGLRQDGAALQHHVGHPYSGTIRSQTVEDGQRGAESSSQSRA